MARKKPVERRVHGQCFPEAWGNKNLGLRSAAERVGKEFNIGFLYVDRLVPFGDFFNTQLKPWAATGGFPRRVCLLLKFPIDPTILLDWRTAIVEEGEVHALRTRVVPLEPPADWEAWLLDQLGDWNRPVPEPENPAIVACTRVRADERPEIPYDPGFLTIPPYGRMEAVIERLDQCRRTYQSAVNPRFLVENRAKVRRALNELLGYGAEDQSEGKKSIEEVANRVQAVVKDCNLAPDRRKLPRVLLLGESGVGKTLVAQYLAWDGTRQDQRPYDFVRLAIPAYLQREVFFENEVFGYCHGAFTDARREGSPGFLLQSIGGVVFFDEIGDASPSLQAKLLAYLDDYSVRPAGWHGDAIPCPMLVVAATNQSIVQSAATEKQSRAQRFRNDLIQRFNVVITVPSLLDRVDELEFLLEAVLQIEYFNPGRAIKGIGCGAWRKLDTAIRGGRFAHGNFRLLESVLSAACRRAVGEGRNVVLVGDLYGDPSHDQLWADPQAVVSSRGQPAPRENHGPTRSGGEIEIVVRPVHVVGRGAIVLTGPSGCGKGAIAGQLLNVLNLGSDRHLSAGELLRQTLSRALHEPAFCSSMSGAYGISGDVSVFDRERNPDEVFGKAGEHAATFNAWWPDRGWKAPSQVAWCDFCVANGLLLPDQWSDNVVGRTIAEKESLRQGIFLLDGYPRTTESGRYLIRLLGKLSIPVLRIVHLSITRDEAISRGRLRKRDDDAPEVLLRRYQFYIDKVQPTVDYLKQELGPERVVLVDAHQPVLDASMALDVGASIRAVAKEVFRALGPPRISFAPTDEREAGERGRTGGE